MRDSIRIATLFELVDDLCDNAQRVGVAVGIVTFDPATGPWVHDLDDEEEPPCIVCGEPERPDAPRVEGGCPGCGCPLPACVACNDTGKVGIVYCQCAAGARAIDDDDRRERDDYQDEPGEYGRWS